MTEEVWLANADPFAMLDSLKGWSSDRKIRLLACGCCTLIVPALIYGPSQDSVAVAESHADGLKTDHELEEANRSARQYVHEVYGDEGYWGNFGCLVTENDPWDAAHYVTRHVVFHKHDEASEVRTALRSLILDIFGNPYRITTLDLRWCTSDVLGLAQAIYDDRAFDRMPILADALMDAGCEDEQIIAHCRSDGPHVRGCWVVDLVLGKS